MSGNETDFGEIRKLVEQAALTTVENSRQMGLVTSQLSDHEERIRGAETTIGVMKNDFEIYKASQMEKEYIEPSDKDGLRITLENRVASILKDNNIDDSYFGRFMRKGWADGKRKANIVGPSGVYTKKMHLEMAMNYLGTWSPEGYGIEGYKNHLDKIGSGR